jgi:hypothetical protein
MHKYNLLPKAPLKKPKCMNMTMPGDYEEEEVRVASFLVDDFSLILNCLPNDSLRFLEVECMGFTLMPGS